MTRQQASRLVHSLFECWGPSLVRYAFRATSSRETAEDVVQEAFMGLYRALRKGASVSNPKGWTLIAVRNQISKYWRSRKRHGEDSQPQESLEAIPDQDRLWKRVEQLDVLQLFAVLTPREEEVMLLRLQSLKYREIASELGISEKSVATLLARALKKLRMAAGAKSKGRRLSFVAKDHARNTLQ